jgi:hypothetical protein
MKLARKPELDPDRPGPRSEPARGIGLRLRAQNSGQVMRQSSSYSLVTKRIRGQAARGDLL